MMNWKTTILTLLCLSCCTFLMAQSNCVDRAVPLDCSRTVFSSNSNGTNQFDASDYAGCVSSSPNGTSSYNGKESVYSINIESSFVRVTVQDLRADVGVFILQDCSNGLRCVASNTSVGGRNLTIARTLPAGRYYVVLDGMEASERTNFALTVACNQADDDDNDGGGGGGSTDCISHPCSGAPTIECGRAYTDSTVGKTSRLNSDCNYGNGCVSSHDDYKAGDRVYKLRVPSGSDKLTVKISNFSSNLDLFLFNDCDLDHCIAASRNKYSSTETIEVHNPQSGTYYVVVDGPDAHNESHFRIDVDCQQANNFSCSNLYTLECGKGYSLDNRHGSNDLDYHDYSSCVSGLSRTYYPYSGKELVYKVKAEAGKSLEIFTQDLHDNLDLFLFRSCYGDQLSHCVARSINDGSHEERIFIEYPESGFYYLVIDGRDQHQLDAFKLFVRCEPLCEDEVDEDCDDLHFSFKEYDNYERELIYTFQVPSHYPSGYWKVKSSSGVQTFQAGRTINLKFSRNAVYTVCYVYKQNGCDIECCKRVEVVDPNDCDLISQSDRDGQIKLSVAGTNYRARSWRQVDSDESVSGSSTEAIVDEPAEGTCDTYEALLVRNSIYRYCRVKVCNDDDTPDLTWLNDLLAQLEACCAEENLSVRLVVQKGTLDGETVYLVPDCASSDGFVTLYTEEGEIICQEGGFAGLVCRDINEVDNLETIFECGDDAPTACVQFSNQTLTCDASGIVTYTAKVSVPDSDERVTINFSIDERNQVRFADCNLSAVATLEAGEEKTITLQLENCSGELLEPGTPVDIEVDVDGEDGCDTQFIELGISECDDCQGTPNDDQVCTQEYDPVCGCDGQTYGNACEADAAGVNLWIKGECPTTATDGADLSLSIDTNADGFGQYENVTFRVEVRNDGPLDAENVFINVPIPTASAFTSAITTIGGYRIGSRNWEIGSIAAGESGVLEFTVFSLSNNTPITIYAQVTRSSEEDPDSTPGNGNGESTQEDDEASFTLRPDGNANDGNVGSRSTNITDLTNFPNPFQTETMIQFYLNEAERATLSVFDVNGKNILEINRDFEAGVNQVMFRADHLSAGIYYYRLSTQETTLTKSMLLTK
ncbi:MAG: pre-peptidase C-terminal domain-containing protein [Bacteroidota bacterium]